MDVTPLNFWDHFRSQSNAGRLAFRDERLLLCSPEIFGRLRKDLLASMGEEATRRLFLQAGFSTGEQEAEFLRRSYPEADQADLLKLGRFFQTQKGWVVSNAQLTDFHPEADPPRFKMKGSWRSSFEAETHLTQIGRSEIPVCWFLTGYLSGFASQVMGRRILYAESRCHGTGDDECRWLGKPEEEWGEKAEAYRALFTTPIEAAPVAPEKPRKPLRPPPPEPPPAPVMEKKPPSEAADPFEQALDWAAGDDHPILLFGGPGSDLETPARAVHDRSSRRTGPFVVVPCAVLPQKLLESGLRPGGDLFRRAHEGTLCLQDLEALPLEVQDRLAETLPGRDAESGRVDEPRFILTTTMKLSERVRVRAFRRELFRRLRPYTLRVPPLSDRPNTVLRLADELLRALAAKSGKPALQFDPAVRRIFADYPWPGNDRELKDVIERAVLLSDGNRIVAADLPPRMIPTGTARAGAVPAGRQGDRLAFRKPQTGRPGRRKDLYDRCSPDLLRIRDETRRLHMALEISSGRLGRAAALLGISRITLWRKLKDGGK